MPLLSPRLAGPHRLLDPAGAGPVMSRSCRESVNSGGTLLSPALTPGRNHQWPSRPPRDPCHHHGRPPDSHPQARPAAPRPRPQGGEGSPRRQPDLRSHVRRRLVRSDPGARLHPRRRGQLMPTHEHDEPKQSVYSPDRQSPLLAGLDRIRKQVGIAEESVGSLEDRLRLVLSPELLADAEESTMLTKGGGAPVYDSLGDIEDRLEMLVAQIKRLTERVEL